MIRFIALAFLCCLSLPGPGAADTSGKILKIAVLKFGTVMWELDTIKRYGLDKSHGYTLEVQPVANKQAAAVMLQAGETHAIVSDWIWAARQWDDRRFAVLPYSTAVGGVVVKNRALKSVADLKGVRIAVAGGPLDKNWLMLRAYAKNKYGFDPAKESEVVFGAPPLIHRKMLEGEFDAEINFWHYLARSKAAGLSFLTTTEDLSKSMNLSVEVPLLVYVFKQQWVEENTELFKAFARSSWDAKKRLRQDMDAWNELKPVMKANTQKEFELLRSDFLQGIPKAQSWPPISEMAGWINFLRNNGGDELVGKITTLSPEMFLSGDD